jgi:diguanylate cyclase (GGDEF)-like protein/PAS domain S-box-containing protein
MYQYVPYLVVSYILFFLILALMLYAWSNRTILGARLFLLTLVLIEIWITAQAFEMSAVRLETKIVWANIQYIPIMLTTVSYFILTLQFTCRERWLKLRWLIVLLLIVPTAVNVFLWIDGTEHLIRQNVHMDYSGTFPTVGKTYGTLFWLLVSYNYSVIIFTMLNLAHAFKEKITLYRKQNILLFVALLFPVAANILQISGLNPFNIDLTPPFFGFSALIISLGIFKYNLFSIVPIARSIIIQEMKSGMIVLDNDGRLLDINPAARKMLHLVSENLLGQSIEAALGNYHMLIQAFKAGKDAVFEIPVEHSSDSLHYEITLTQIKNTDKRSMGRLIQIYDISERKNAEELIQYAALHDPLTGLPNRKLLQILFSQELSLAKMRGDSLVVAFLDMDNFKTINDTHGHAAGDSVLCEVSARLRDALRESDIISRIGGDEFAIIFPHIGSEENLDIIAGKILDVFDMDIELPEGPQPIQASVGFSVFPRDGDSIADLLNKADKAMYSIKGSRKRNKGTAVE